MPRLVSALAAGSSSWVTVRGISASRLGRCIDEVDASPTLTTKISHTLGSSRNALTASTAVNAACATPHADEQLAPVDVVGQRAAVQAEDDQRHQLDEADRADREVGAGQRVDLVGDRDVADHRAEVEDRAGVEQQPEVARGAQRGEVHAQRAEPLTPGHEREQSHWTGSEENPFSRVARFRAGAHRAGRWATSAVHRRGTHMSAYEELLGTAARIADAAIEWDDAAPGLVEVRRGLGLRPVPLSDADLRPRLHRDVRPDRRRGRAPAPPRGVRPHGRHGLPGDLARLVRADLRHVPPLAGTTGADRVHSRPSTRSPTRSPSSTSRRRSPGTPSARRPASRPRTRTWTPRSRRSCGEILAMSGAMDTFAVAYSNRVPGVVRAQAAILGMLGCTLAAEQNLFAELRHDVATGRRRRPRGHEGPQLRWRRDGTAASSARCSPAPASFFTGGASAAAIANGRRDPGRRSARSCPRTRLRRPPRRRSVGPSRWRSTTTPSGSSTT